MREAHAHIAAFGEALSLPRLDACTSLAECLDQARASASGAAPGRWVRLAGARIESWPEQRWPTREELDRMAPLHPCAIQSFDYHAVAANSAALALAGLKPGERVGANGEVCVDRRTGAATGLLLEDAAGTLWRTAPEPPAAQRESMVRASLAHFSALGFDEIHDLHAPEWLGPLLGSLDRQGVLKLRIRLYPNVESLPAIARSRSSWETERVRLAGGKLFADGTLNSRTALMLVPYREPLDEDSRLGRAMVRPSQIDDAIRLTESLGLHLAVHAIGDGAVRAVLDSLERTATTRPPPNRHRIEHCELIDESDVPRFARLGVICSVQPCHLLTDIEVLTRQLPHRLDRVLPLRELIDAGCAPGTTSSDGLLWFGSDAPIVRPDPGDSIQAAVQRRRPEMPESQAISWEQRITEGQAWDCFARESSA